MAKKRQPDFQKKKLKPGRSLPKGRNVTKLSYKAKKIIMPRQAHKEKSDLTIVECIKNACHSGGKVQSKENALNQLNNLILKQKDTFLVYLSEIFEKVAELILHDEEQIRNAAVKVLATVLEHSDDKKISTFFTLLTNILSCGMTHPDLKIKGAALNLLNTLLSSHPNLTCCSITLLQNLLSLLTGQSYNTKSRKAVNKSTVPINYGDGVISQDWRFHVLAHMNMFLKAMLENFETGVEKDDEENIVNWDCKGTLYLEIFAGSGLKPVDIEKFTSCLAEKNELRDPAKVEELLTDFIEVLSKMFIEEFTGSSKGDDDLIVRETIENLNVLFQVLCYLGEWVTVFRDSYPELEMFFARSLAEKFFKLIEKFPFIPRGPLFEAKNQPKYQYLPCVRLNLSVCYLYTAFILKFDSSSDSFLGYPDSVLHMPYEVRYDSIPVLLKIARLYVSRMKTPQLKVVPAEYLRKMLFQMTKMLKVEDDRPNVKMLISFFVEMSLEIGNQFNSEYLKNWYFQLLSLLRKLKGHNTASRKFLKDVRKIAIRKNSYFLDALDRLDVEDFKEMLQHENYDLKETAVYLIYNMREISEELFQVISDVILTDSTFPLRSTSLLIRLLTNRFSNSREPAEDRINFIIFLLNTAIDAVNLVNEKWLNYDLPAFADKWKLCHEGIPFIITPSLHWTQHSKLFELCHQSLSRFHVSTVNRITMAVIHEALEHTTYLPIHCAIAILMLNGPLCHMVDLTFSSLFFLSVFSSVEVPDDWYQLNLVPLMNSLTLNRIKALEIMQFTQCHLDSPIPGIVAHYILRICMYFAECKYFLLEDGNMMLSILKCVKDKSTDETLYRQKLYHKLFNYFIYYKT